MQKFSIGVVTIMAMVAVLLPACMAVGCSMGLSGMAGSKMLGLTSACAKTVTSVAQAAVAPGSQQSLILTLVAALGMVVVFFAPPLVMRPVRAVAEDPPPKPEDPRGVRLII